jgi:myo-inositol-1(or 4)-monophosphatase
MNYKQLAKDLSELVQEAGAQMLGSVDRQATAKTSARDLVTVADIKAQNLITKKLNQIYPDIAVVSEELTEEQQKPLYSPDFTGFVVDPIDGTYNFKRDMHESAVSIGYIEEGETRVGAVCNPYRNELFSAVKGEGVFCNGQPIHVSDQTDLDGASIAFSNSYDNDAMMRNLKRHLAICEQTGIMPWTNCPGSGVVILTHLAIGRMDIYHHNGLKPWDNAAGFLLIREAGGKILTLRGEEAPFTSPSILGGTPALVDQLLAVFNKIDQTLLK